MTNQPGGDETIRARRRRQGASEGLQGGERAEEHARQRPQTGGGSGGGGFQRPTGGGGGQGGGGLGGLKLPTWAIVLLIIGYIAYSLFFSGPTQDQPGGSDPYPTGVLQQQATEPLEALPTATRAPAKARPTSAQPAVSGQKWTVMLYQDADDQILEQDIYIDLNEVERVGSSDRVQIVAQVDRFKGAFKGDGNWTGTRRYHITRDDDLSAVNSELVDDLGEVDMAEANTLVDFVTWTAKNYPADKYVLILSDHGMGWPGGFSDPDPAGRDPSRVPLANVLEDDNLFLMELDGALDTSLRQAGIDKFEIIGMDACLMGHLEVLAALEPYGRYAVLSQETEPALGWAYTSFLQSLVDNPDMSGADLSQKIVDSYIQDDQRIVDNQARADFMRQGSSLGGLFGGSGTVSAATLASQLSRGVTLTAVDLAKVPALMDSVNDLAYTLQSENPDLIVSARTYAPSFTNIFGKDMPSPYIDLGGFVQMLKREGGSAQTNQAGDQVLAAIQDAVVAEKHGSGKSGATGVSIYFPNSTLYRTAVAGMQSYTSTASRFAQNSLWDNFLTYFFNDVGFQRQPAQPIAPSFDQPSRSPGLGQIKLSPITLSAKTAAPNQPVTLTTKITGTNIGYIYLFVGLYDRKANSIWKADTDFLESSKTQELNGVYYPQWSSGKSFNLEFEWEPTLFQITDGETTTVALFTPQNYGASPEEAIYSVDGIYHYADGADRPARMLFRDGKLTQIFGFTDANETGGAREIVPQAGDTFTILEKWLDLDSSGQVEQAADQEGATLTFSGKPFEWKEVYAAPGDYVVGFIVQDLDGNNQQVYTNITVK